MNMHYRTYLFSFIACVFLLSTQYVHALSVSPAKIELDGDPGSVLTGIIEVHNDQPSTQNVYISFENFEPGDDSGTPRFVGADGGLATWFTAVPSLALSPDEHAQVAYRIQIPSTAEPGGYFAAVFFGNQPPSNSDSQLAIGGRLGVLTLLRVSGDIPESAGVSEFRTKQAWYTEPPVAFEYRFSNTGGDRVVPRGDITISNTFGARRGVIPANPVTGSVLPSSSRRFQSEWVGTQPDTIPDDSVVDDSQPTGYWSHVRRQWNDFAFGWYSATLDIGWGVASQGTTDSVRFLIIPWQLLLLVVSGITILAVVIRTWLRWYRTQLIRQIEARVSHGSPSNQGTTSTRKRM
jgi:hypothetical protein